MPLTIKEIENAKPREKKYKLADSGGLCLHCPALGWKGLALAVSVRWHGKEHELWGLPTRWPQGSSRTSLRGEKVTTTGINPMAERKAEAEATQEEAKAAQREAENSFENVARKWWPWWSIGKSPRHAETLMNRLEADVFPVIGHLSIHAVQTSHIREILRVFRETESGGYGGRDLPQAWDQATDVLPVEEEVRQPGLNERAARLSVDRVSGKLAVVSCAVLSANAMPSSARRSSRAARRRASKVGVCRASFQAATGRRGHSRGPEQAQSNRG